MQIKEVCQHPRRKGRKSWQPLYTLVELVKSIGSHCVALTEHMKKNSKALELELDV